MAEPFEFISRGMDLAAQGKFTDAEKYIQRGDSRFSLEIDVSSEEGISQSALENQIKETLRQIGARVEEEYIE
jgi:hypothetical protein